MDANSMLRAYRPMSQLLRLYVVPEIDARVAAGTLRPADLPFQVYQFRFLQSGGKSAIEINDDVHIVGSVKLTRSMSIKAGQPLTLADIDSEDCLMEPPTLEGTGAAFFLCRSQFLNFMTMFDFTPNAPPHPSGVESEERPMRYPIAEMAEAEAMFAVMDPTEKFKELADASWPPGPGHVPNVLWHIHNDAGSLQDPGFGDVAATSHSEAYWKRQVDFWTATDVFGDRLKYVTESIGAYLAGDYITSIYVLVPHLEGIVLDYLTAAGVAPRYRVESRVEDLKSLVLSRKVLMFPRSVLDRIFTFIETGSFLSETSKIKDPATEVTRHGIAHGIFKNFDNRDIALKYLILLDALAYVILHDKLLAGTL
jgi:hypothetical protein